MSARASGCMTAQERTVIRQLMGDEIVINSSVLSTRLDERHEKEDSS
jgi:hypothetical protein